MSRYFTNPNGFTSCDGAPTRVIEVTDSGRKLSHLTDGNVTEGKFASSTYEGALDRCLRAVDKGIWIELTFHQAFPHLLPETTTEVVW